MLTQDRLKAMLNYDPETGNFTWLQNRCKVKAGSLAGYKDRGYILIRVDQGRYLAHRLAWFYMYNEWPEEDIDHINGCPSDNRINNLRKASRSENLRNIGVRKNSKTGVAGVSYCKASGKYRVSIRATGKRITVGLFETVEEGAKAYREAAEKYHGEFAGHLSRS